MKFYKEKKYYKYYTFKIYDYKLTAIYCDSAVVIFYKNGSEHNSKNASNIDFYGYKQFCLNGKFYGDKYNFTKQSWRKFVKLQAFL
jgi:hypothetical protein